MTAIVKNTGCIFRLSTDLILVSSNSYIETLLGFDPTGLPFHELLFRPKRDLRTLLEGISNHDHVDFIADFKRIDGNFITLQAVIIEVTESDKIGYVVHLKDYTRIKMLRKDAIRKTIAIEQLAKARTIREGNLIEAVYEIVLTAARAMHVNRVNAWTFDTDQTEIQCIGNYDTTVNAMVSQSALPKIAFPNYFSLFETSKIIVTNDAMNDPKTEELKDIYLEPHNICALMDVPIRIEGEMIGVVCFEHIGSSRDWNIQEQKFGLVIAQIISLAIETNNKLIAQRELLALNKEQQVLLQEIHHRVKNNLSIVSSLLNLQAHKCRDQYHSDLFSESQNRLSSISSVHEVIYKSKSFATIDLKDYIEQMLSFLQQSYASAGSVNIVKSLQKVNVDVSIAIPLALIINEIVTNCFKHAFKDTGDGTISVILIENNKIVNLTINDDGIGMNLNKDVLSESIGIDILEGLVEQIDGKYAFTVNKGTQFKLTFSL
jgi:two-component sensor histidine kinase